MKKHRIAGIGLALILLMAGCSSQTKQAPKEVVEQFMAAVQKQDETALKATSQWDMTSIQALQMQEDDYLDTLDHDLQKDAHEVLYGFTYTVEDESIQEDSTTVKVILHKKDIKDAVKDGMKQAEKKVEELSKGKNFSDQQAQQEILRILYESIRDTKKDRDIKVNVALKKNDDQWIVSKSNDALEKALLSNGEDLINLVQ